AIGHPELVIFGLEPHICQPILNEIADYVIFQDVRIGSGDEVAVANWRFLAIAVPNPADVVVRANDFYRKPVHNSVPVLQLVYPDVHGVWPWEPHCHLFPGQQPLPGEFPGADEPRSA
ncbi:MAG TPA: DUF4262 domain-containing protein, partial [Jatrophihabitans sp.]|nr:DUF4262 domain-containing protein [Jatrophihabitans sp.]